MSEAGRTDLDALVVGAGLGGIYAVHRLRGLGLRVLGVDGADGFGGVWFHNRYPGARVDLPSVDYCYYFSEALFREWDWTERFATQPELLRYLDHVVDRFDLRRSFRLRTRVVGAQWQPAERRYLISFEDGTQLTTRFLVMATGNLSRPRELRFPGLERFAGEWVQTSHWPDSTVELSGRRVGVIGTGSSGVQTIPAIAGQVGELVVFQRSPNFSIPAVNGPIDEILLAEVRADVADARDHLLTTPSGTHARRGTRPAHEYSVFEQRDILERQWHRGGHEFSMLFTDQALDKSSNEIVAEFVREKIRTIVRDADLAERLSPRDHPIASRRLCLDTDYYATYNLPHVRHVDLRTDPIETITEKGIRTSAGLVELDLIVFATGFTPFVGALDAAGIRNEAGASPTDSWTRGPRTYLGLLVDGFPNLFALTGPGSPSVLANMALANEQHVDWVADLVCHMDSVGASEVRPALAAVDAWTARVTDDGRRLLSYGSRNYMVRVNADGSRAFLPYPGGFGRYVQHSAEVAAGGYRELEFG